MFKSDYCKFAEDFAFLKEYGYFFWSENKHNVCPSVSFRNKKEELQIGYKYDEKKIYVSRYIPPDSFPSEDLLTDIDISGSSYKEQVDQVRELLYSYLNDKNKWIDINLKAD